MTVCKLLYVTLQNVVLQLLTHRFIILSGYARSSYAAHVRFTVIRTRRVARYRDQRTTESHADLWDQIGAKHHVLVVILLLWMIWTLNLNIIYNSIFTSSLADSDIEGLAKDLKEIPDFGMPLVGSHAIQSFSNDFDDPIIVDLRDK